MGTIRTMSTMSRVALPVLTMVNLTLKLSVGYASCPFCLDPVQAQSAHAAVAGLFATSIPITNVKDLVAPTMLPFMNGQKFNALCHSCMNEVSKVIKACEQNRSQQIHAASEQLAYMQQVAAAQAHAQQQH